MNYLPVKRSEWEETLLKQRKIYDHFIDEIIGSPAEGYESNFSSRVDVTLDDHPLNPNPDSKWLHYFKDNEVLLQIDKDVRRLCPDIAFFQRPTEFPNKRIVNNPDAERLHKRIEVGVLRSANVTRKGLGVTKITLVTRKANEEYAPLARGQEAHWEVVERLLFIYAKLNPGQSYVQGMNEIIGPLYYTMASDTSSDWKKNAEADCFFCFTNLMSEIRQNFIRTLDDSDSGIINLMQQYCERLRRHDEELSRRLKQLDLVPQYYSFRWLILLLSQEFPLPDVIRIWDSLFSDPHRFDFLLEVCCAMVIMVRNEILTNDFSSNVKLLQNFPSTDVQKVLTKAVLLQHKSIT